MAGTTSPKTATRATATANSLLITASSKECVQQPTVVRRQTTSTTATETPATVRLIKDGGPERQEKTTLCGLGLLSVPHGPQPLEGGPSKRAIGAELPRSPEA